MNWRLKASCKNLPPETADRLFFPENGIVQTIVKKICGGCPVRPECQNFANHTRASGVWAGNIRKGPGERTPEERREQYERDKARAEAA